MTVSQLRSALQGSRERLFASIRGLSEEQFRFVPAAREAEGGGWSIATHLAHLLRCERMFVERAGLAVAQGELFVASTGVTNADDAGLGQHLAVPQVVHGLLNARRELEALLDACDDAGLERAIVHETRGRMTVRDMVITVGQHEDEHAAEIARIARQVPASGRVIIPLTPRS